MASTTQPRYTCPCTGAIFWGQDICSHCKAPIDWTRYDADIQAGRAHLLNEDGQDGFVLTHHLIRYFGPHLGPYGLAMYHALRDHVAGKDRPEKGKKKDTCYPSYTQLALETGMSRPQAVEAVALLIGVDLVRPLGQRSFGESNLYYVVPLPAWWDEHRIVELPALVAQFKRARAAKKELTRTLKTSPLVSVRSVTVRTG